MYGHAWLLVALTHKYLLMTVTEYENRRMNQIQPSEVDCTALHTPKT